MDEAFRFSQSDYEGIAEVLEGSDALTSRKIFKKFIMLFSWNADLENDANYFVLMRRQKCPAGASSVKGSGMSTAGLFRDDYLIPSETLDENTVITDYWLDFVAARAGVDTPAQVQTQIVTEDLHEKVQGFGHSIESLLEGSKQLQLELERITCARQPYSERIRDWGSTNNSLQDSMQNLVSDPLHTHQLSAREVDQSSACRQRSMADRLRSSSLYTTIQKLL